MSTFNAAYSKWDNIELSDDESDLHPNIDKDSWFRMKHRSRLEREEKEDKEMEAMNRCTGDDEQRLKIIKARIEAIKSGKLDPDEASVDDIEGNMHAIKEVILHHHSLSHNTPHSIFHFTSFLLPYFHQFHHQISLCRSARRDR